MDISYSLFANVHARYGNTITETWLNLCARLGNHQVGEKDGWALTCGTFRDNAPRGNDSLISRALVALDVEMNPRTGEIPPSFDVVIEALSLRRQAAMAWTTHSHIDAMPRYRILMPLSRALAYDPLIDNYITSAAACELGFPSTSDPSKFGAASLFFLPRHREGAPFRVQRIEGSPIAAGYLITSAMTAAQGVAQLEAEVASHRRVMPDDVRQAIDSYNNAHPLRDQLVRYGYRRDGNRYKSRYQHAASQGATTIIDNGRAWVSFSESDAQAGVGKRPSRIGSQAACFGDSFGLYCHYEHNGIFHAAVSALQRREVA